MTLYTPSTFAGSDVEAATKLIDAHPFATLLTATDGAEPQISHVPLLLRDGALWGHVARANPHWRLFAGARTVAIFHGPHAYVSPRWYEQPERSVPTWNYATVHVSGTPELLDDEASRRVLRDLTARLESGAWTPHENVLSTMVRGIVAFRMPVARWEAKFKMNQNRTPADREGVIAGLRATGHPDEQAVAAWMEERG